MYEVTMTNEQIRSKNPFDALEETRAELFKQIKADGKDPLHYITQSTNTDDGGIKITATYSEERKQHFGAMTPEELAKIRG